MRTLTDIGVNLADSSFDQDREAVVARAQEAGVSRMVITGSCTRSNPIALALAAAKPELLWSTAGIHPHHAEQCSEAAIKQIEECISNTAVRAVGECGLDYFRDIAPRARQHEAFEAQLELAAQHALPVFLHQRDAIDDFVEIMKQHRDQISRGVAHCFTDDASALKRLLDLDLYIGITGWICDERRGRHLLEIVREIPENRLMIETDAPYLMPRTLRPRPKTRRNEPQWLPEIARVVAAARDCSPEALAETTTRNAMRFFARDSLAE